jgi:hypothetical protein
MWVYTYIRDDVTHGSFIAVVIIIIIIIIIISRQHVSWSGSHRV